MKTGELITEWIAPIFGVCIANLMFLTPIRVVLKARKDRTLSDLNPIPWSAITGNCIAWLGYSFYKKDWFVYCANQPGFLLGVFYTLTAIGLSNKRTQDMMMMILLILCFVLPFIAVILNLGLGESVTNEKKTFVWGLLCNFILVCYYTAPLSTLLQVVRTKSAATLHWPSCLMNLINGTCWVAYGIAIKDYFIACPNAAGMILSLIQMTLIAIYKPKRGSHNNNNNNNHPMSTRSFFFPAGRKNPDTNTSNANGGTVSRTNSETKLFNESSEYSSNGVPSGVSSNLDGRHENKV